MFPPHVPQPSVRVKGIPLSQFPLFAALVACLTIILLVLVPKASSLMCASSKEWMQQECPLPTAQESRPLV